MTANYKPSYVRRRSRNTGVINHSLTSTVINANGTSSSTTSSSGTTGKSEVMIDVVTPNFKELQAQGSVIMNPLNKWTTETKAGAGYVNSYEQLTGKTYIASGSNLTRWKEANFPRTTIIGKADNQATYDRDGTVEIAIQKAIANIDSTDFRFGEDLVEIGKSLSYLRRPLESAADILRNFEKDYARRRRRGITHAKALADAWLSARYGMRPIVASMLNVHKASTFLGRKPERRTARGFANATYSDSGTYTRTWGAGTGDVYDWERYDELKVRATIVYEGKPIVNNLDLLGLRGKEIPSTVWAVFPYSWVVDRFVNVSRVLQGLMNLADPKISIKGACVTVTETSTSKKQLVNTFAPYWTITGQGDVALDVNEYKTRSAFIPSVANLAPIWEPRLDLAFITDLTSLCLQRIRLGSFDTR